jgi:hypothetical protein
MAVAVFVEKLLESVSSPRIALDGESAVTNL